MTALLGTSATLAEAYDLLLVDLDGVVYVGDEVIEAAPVALSAARDRGVAVVFVTNNASRSPAAVAAALTGMGVATEAGEVMTSAVGAAQELARELPAGSPVLVVGGAGVREALTEAGLVPVEAAADGPVAVLQGFAPDVGWRSLAEASVALRAGAIWVATNADLTLPSPRGPLPGNGSLVAALAAATGLEPRVVGKPGPLLFDAARRGLPDRRALVVGDRLDTDIAGAYAATLPSLCVLSGVSRAHDLMAAPPGQRPAFIGRDLSALRHRHHPADTDADGTARCNEAHASIRSGAATVSGDGGPDGLDQLRALCALAWSSDNGQTALSYQEALESLDLD